MNNRASHLRYVDKDWFIYSLVDPRSEDVVRYVGVTCNPSSRLRMHVSEARNRKTSPYKNNWIRKLLKDGVRPLFKILEYGRGDGWEMAEMKWIATHWGENLTNRTMGGDHGPRLVSEETRRKRSINAMGRIFSDITCQRIRESKLGKKRPKTTPEMNEAMSLLHPRKNQTHCKHGHPFTAENTYIEIRKENGRQKRQCMECRRLISKRRQHAHA